MKFFVQTCDRTMHNIPAFAYLFNKFWGNSQEVIILHFDKIPENIPNNFKLHKLGSSQEYQTYFTDPLIKLMNSLNDEYFMFTLDDHWLYAPVDHDSLNELKTYVGIADRIFLHDAERPSDPNGSHSYESNAWEVYKEPNIITRIHKTKYRWFNQGIYIYKKQYINKYLTPKLNVWEFETNGCHNTVGSNDIFIASKKFPCKYRDVWVGNRGPENAGYYFNGYPENFPQHLITELLNNKLIQQNDIKK